MGNSTGEVRRYIYKGGSIYGVRAKSVFVVIDFGDGGADEELLSGMGVIVSVHPRCAVEESTKRGRQGEWKICVSSFVGCE